MKKVLAVFLALLMALSCTSAAFAYEIANNDVYFGAKEDIQANPGDLTSFTFVLKSLASEEDLAGVDPNGVLSFPVGIFAFNGTLGPMHGATITPPTEEEEGTYEDALVLTDAAKKAGVTLNTNPDECYISGESIENLVVSLPAEYLFNHEEVELFKLYINVSDQWEVENYHEKEPLGVMVQIQGDCVVTNPEGSEEPEVYLNQFRTADAVVTAKFYEPNFFERVWEWIKAQIRLLIDIDNIIDNLLYTEVFNPADWYNEWKSIKDSEKAAKQAEKEAKKAEKAAG